MGTATFSETWPKVNIVLINLKEFTLYYSKQAKLFSMKKYLYNKVSYKSLYKKVYKSHYKKVSYKSLYIKSVL